MDTHKAIQANTVGPWFHIVCIAITSLSIAALIFINLHYFDAQEQMPRVDVVYNQDMVSSIPTIKTGIFMRDISDFDVLKGKFNFNLVIWFSFDPTKISQDLVDQFTFEKAKEDFRSAPVIRLDTEHERIVEYTLRLSVSMPLNYRHFPVDDHSLNLVLGNYVISPETAMFVTDPRWIIVNPEIHVEGWRFMNTDARAGHMVHSINPYNEKQIFDHARVVFSLNFERSGVRHLFSIILPMLIIFFVTLFSFSINTRNSDYYNVVALSVGSVMALIAYRFVIETISPNTAYFTISDYMFMFFLCATFTVLFINALESSISASKKKIVTVVLHVLTILVCAYFFAPWW